MCVRLSLHSNNKIISVVKVLLYKIFAYLILVHIFIKTKSTSFYFLLQKKTSFYFHRDKIDIIFFVDRRKGKVIINSHKWRYRSLNSGHDIRPNNFDILLVELGFLNPTLFYIALKIYGQNILCE